MLPNLDLDRDALDSSEFRSIKGSNFIATRTTAREESFRYIKSINNYNPHRRCFAHVGRSKSADRQHGSRAGGFLSRWVRMLVFESLPIIKRRAERLWIGTGGFAPDSKRREPPHRLAEAQRVNSGRMPQVATIYVLKPSDAYGAAIDSRSRRASSGSQRESTVGCPVLLFATETGPNSEMATLIVPLNPR